MFESQNCLLGIDALVHRHPVNYERAFPPCRNNLSNVLPSRCARPEIPPYPSSMPRTFCGVESDAMSLRDYLTLITRFFP
jgi:hypothetical protein